MPYWRDSSTCRPWARSVACSCSQRNRDRTGAASQRGIRLRPARMSGLSSTVSASRSAPPGRRTRQASATAAATSGRWCRTWMHHTAAKVASAKGSASASAASARPAVAARAASGIAGSTPTASIPRATIRRSQKPLPHPRSSTRPSRDHRSSRDSIHGLIVVKVGVGGGSCIGAGCREAIRRGHAATRRAHGTSGWPDGPGSTAAHRARGQQHQPERRRPLRLQG